MGLLEERAPSDVDSEFGIIELDSHLNLPRWLPVVMAPFVYLRSIHWRLLIARFFMFLVPSFLQSRHMREQIRPAKIGPTAYLDGMRGLAALFVYFCHYFYQAFTIAEGYGCGETNYHILKLPFLRLWYQGPAAVCVFFVISGYALTYKPLKLIRSRSWAEFSNCMSSLTFRRAIRLYMPTAISTLMIIALLRTGAYEWTRPFATDRTYHKNIMEPHPSPKETLSEQLWDWAWQMFRFVHVWGWEPHGGNTCETPPTSTLLLYTDMFFKHTMCTCGLFLSSFDAPSTSSSSFLALPDCRLGSDLSLFSASCGSPTATRDGSLSFSLPAC